MHSAPSVTYPVGRSSFLGGLLVLIWWAGAGAVGFAWLVAGLGGWRAALACAVLLFSAAAAMHLWHALAAGTLRWDGHAWYGPGSADGPRPVYVHLDLQRHLLVRLPGVSGRSQWLWLASSSDPSRWQDLRRAVYSPALPDPLRDAANP
jgi:hypothetical protein